MPSPGRTAELIDKRLSVHTSRNDSSSNAGATETLMASRTIPANTLPDGSLIEIEAMLVMTDVAAETLQIEVTANGTPTAGDVLWDVTLAAADTADGDHVYVRVFLVVEDASPANSATISSGGIAVVADATTAGGGQTYADALEDTAVDLSTDTVIGLYTTWSVGGTVDVSLINCTIKASTPSPNGSVTTP